MWDQTVCSYIFIFFFKNLVSQSKSAARKTYTCALDRTSAASSRVLTCDLESLCVKHASIREVVSLINIRRVVLRFLVVFSTAARGAPATHRYTEDWNVLGIEKAADRSPPCPECTWVNKRRDRIRWPPHCAFTGAHARRLWRRRLRVNVSGKENALRQLSKPQNIHHRLSKKS